MTKKGEEIKEKILYLLERNPDGLRIGSLVKLIHVSRNSVYRYLEVLQLSGYIHKTSGKIWKLKNPLKPHTILGYQYQAILQGLKIVGGESWDITTMEGKENFKKIGRYVFPKLKIPDLNIEKLKAKSHQLEQVISHNLKLLREASTVEKARYISHLTDDGFPNPNTHLASIVEFEGGYVSSDPVKENGFGHYYIIAGIMEAAVDATIPPIYGGRVTCEVLKYDEDRQIVDIGVYVFFDKKNPYIDPHSGQKIIFD
jgi:hypothetical protein